MKIAVIGSGNVGSALGKGWLRAGHQVVFGVRNPESDKTKKALELIPNATIKTITDSINEAEVVVITTPPEAALELAVYLKNITEKIIIDTTNAFRAKPDPYPTLLHAIKQTAKVEHIVKCFNSTGFENMLNPVYEVQEPAPHKVAIDMFVAGDSSKGKEIAKKLAIDLGFGTCYDFGGDDKVELLEKLAISWINLAIIQGHGRNLAFKVIKR